MLLARLEYSEIMVATMTTSSPPAKVNAQASFLTSLVSVARFCAASTRSIPPRTTEIIPRASTMWGGLMILTSRP